METTAQVPLGTAKTKFEVIPIDPALPSDKQLRLHRLNALGSLFYFIKIVLNRKRLTHALHLPLCQSLERVFIKDLYELPRDHFKSTICSEGRPLWRALPFSQQDADELYALGYADEYIRFMAKIHNPDIKMLLVSENITNAAKLGFRIRQHVESNAVYRQLFPETLPGTQEIWTNFSLHMRRTHKAGPHGEGTFDFLGVGGALQSRHYHEISEDDLVGRKAIESQSIMDKTVEFHQLVCGAFDVEDRQHDNPQLIVGNKWGYHDLNSHIREHEPWFTIHSHGALGGCCPEHPEGVPIFPEEFSVEKLARRRQQLGGYNFSCQFLNNPIAPEDADFKEDWLRYYDFESDVKQTADAKVQHEVYGGNALTDLTVGNLQIAMATDPNHSGNAARGRCRHAIVVVGLSSKADYYLLESWAEAASFDTYIGKLYEIADKYGLTKLGIETVAAQKYLAYHINYLNNVKGRRLRLIELKGEVEAPDGTITRNKEWRIRNVLSPIFERGQFWIRRREHQNFTGEYTTFPKGKYVDILDALAYVPQLLKQSSRAFNQKDWLYQNQRRAIEIAKPYAARLHVN